VVTGFVVIPLLLLPLLARKVREPRIAREHAPAPALPGAVPRRFVRRVVVLALLTGGIAVATGPGFTYLFIYGERVLGSSPLFLSMLVLAAGPVGLLGLIAGRFASNRLGRRITAGVGMGMTGLAIAYGYSGTSRDLAIGYLAAITFASAFAPPAGALAAEVVPTRARATAAGWMTVAGVLGAVLGLTLFGVLGDITGEFASAARVLGIGVAVVAFGFAGLPETRGVELEVLDDEDTRDPR
jgi:predicted MFS family arabinose efflux permease